LFAQGKGVIAWIKLKRLRVADILLKKHSMPVEDPDFGGENA